MAGEWGCQRTSHYLSPAPTFDVFEKVAAIVINAKV